MVWILLPLFGYLMGSIPVGILLSKLKGTDPRRVGSGNIGATNVMRAAGKGLGILTLLGDIVKGVIPTALAISTNQPELLVALTGFLAFCGHLYPLFLHFKGGKGIATSLGVFLVISPLAIAVSAMVFIALLFKWRYVSLGSLVGTALLPAVIFFLGSPPEYFGLSVVLAALIWIKHRDNLRRLMTGSENKIRFSS